MKIGIVYGHISRNLGDLAINYGTAELIKKIAPDADLHVVFGNQLREDFDLASSGFGGLNFTTAAINFPYFQDIQKEESYPAFDHAINYTLDPASFIRDAGIGNCNLILYNSGEHLFTYENGNSNPALIWQCLPALAAKSAGMSFITLPSTIGPVETAGGKQLLKTFFKLNDAIAVREPVSADFASPLLDNCNLPVLLDPAFFIPVPRQVNNINSLTLGMIMRLENFGLRVGTNNSKEYLKACNNTQFRNSLAFKFAVDTARSFFNKYMNSRINFFVQNTADLDLSRAIILFLNEHGFEDRINLIQPLSVSEYIAELSKVNFIISSRFHGCILGLISGKQVIGVHFEEHGHKMPGLFKMLNIPDFCISPSNTNMDKIISSAIQLLNIDNKSSINVKAQITSMQNATLIWLKQSFGLNHAIDPDEIRASVLDYIHGIDEIRLKSIRDIDLGIYNPSSRADKSIKDYEPIIREANRTKLELQHTTKKLDSAADEIEKLKIELQNTTKKSDSAIDEIEKLKIESDLLKRKLSLERSQKKEIRDSFSFRFGHTIVKAFRKPGKNTILLPWHILQLLSSKIVTNSETDSIMQQSAYNSRESKNEASHIQARLVKEGKRVHKAGNYQEWIELAFKNADIPYFKSNLPFVQANYDLLKNGFQPVFYKDCKDYSSDINTIFYLLHNSLPFATGGYSIRTHGLLKAMVKEDWKMHGVTRLGSPFDINVKRGLNVAQMPFNDDLPDIDIIDGIKYLHLFSIINNRNKLPTNTYLQKYIERVIELCMDYRPSLIHGASDYLNGIAAANVASLLKIPSIYEVRGLWEITHISRDPEWLNTDAYKLAVKMETDACKQCTVVVTITSHLKKLLVERGVPADKIVVVPNGVDTNSFTPRQKDKELEEMLHLKGKKVIGYLGAFAPYEGLEYILEAAAILKARGRKDFRVLLVGDGVKYTALQELRDKLRISDIVHITGRVPHTEVNRYYSLVDIAPFPRIGVPVCEYVSPLKPFEAMAMGKAIISSNVMALSEIIDDGSTGLLHRKDDVQHLASLIEKLLDNEELMQKLCINSRQWVIANRDWRILAKTMSNLYHELLNNKNTLYK